MTSDGAFVRLLDKRLSPADIRVALALMDSVAWFSIVRIPRGELIELAQLSREEVSRSITRLSRLGILIRDPDDCHSFRLDPQLVWRGKADDRPSAIIEYLSLLNTNRFFTN